MFIVYLKGPRGKDTRGGRERPSGFAAGGLGLAVEGLGIKPVQTGSTHTQLESG